MGAVRKSVATLRIVGDDLVPEEISRRLVVPTHEPGNLDMQIRELLDKVTSDLEVWRDLVHTYRVDLFCGLFMESGNDGVTLSPTSLAALGQRGIELQLDIYGPVELGTS